MKINLDDIITRFNKMPSKKRVFSQTEDNTFSISNGNSSQLFTQDQSNIDSASCVEQHTMLNEESKPSTS